MTEKVFKAVDRHGATLEFLIKEPDRAIEAEADMRYRIAFGEALKAGLMTRDSIRQVMKEHELWRDSDETELKSVMLELAKLELELKHQETAGDQSAATITAGKLAEHRTRLWQLILMQQGPMANSCETYAELIRMEALMAACIYIKATQKRYWGSYQEYVLERDTNQIATVAQTAMDLTTENLVNERVRILEDNPEQRWLKNFKAANREEVEATAVAVLKQRAEESANANV